jgi:hypothetical protein
MAYIGRTVEYGNAVTQQIPGAARPDYTLTYDTTTDGVVISLDGVVQVNGTDFNIVGTALTFTSDVASGIVINVIFNGLTIGIGVPGDNTITNAKMADSSVDSAELVTGSVDDGHITGVAGNKLTGTVTAKGDGASAVGKLLINCEDNAHGITIQSPIHSSAANYTLTLPVNDGDANELLKTDGAGVLSWAVDSGGGPSLGTDHIIRTNALTISSPITFAGTENGVTYGPITATALVTVTSPSVWHIL